MEGLAVHRVVLRMAGRALMGRRQKGKNHKRKKSWHRGGVERHKYARATRRWPEGTFGGDPTSGAPIPLRRGGSNRPKKVVD